MSTVALPLAVPLPAGGMRHALRQLYDVTVAVQSWQLAPLGSCLFEARAGELEERVGYLVPGPAGFRCALNQLMEGRFQGELALKGTVRVVDRAAWLRDRNA